VDVPRLVLAIAGFPLTSGFWSKDEILWKAFSTKIATPQPARADAPMWSGRRGSAGDLLGRVIAATMTAFYMFRAYFMTFHGNFRGWTIVRGWKDPHAHGHDDHGHHADDEGPIEARAARVAAGDDGPARWCSRRSRCSPASSTRSPSTSRRSGTCSSRSSTKREARRARARGQKGMMWTMMAPASPRSSRARRGHVRHLPPARGEPERASPRACRASTRLIYDKWRIDELYDATVVGMVDALADIFTMADKWIVDGILARSRRRSSASRHGAPRAARPAACRSTPRAMVVGLGSGVGWFIDHAARRGVGQRSRSVPQDSAR
jgi:NADH-quinone oxidoreductase subunit L